MIPKVYDASHLEQVIEWLDLFKHYRCHGTPRDRKMADAMALLEEVRVELPRRHDLEAG